MLIDYITFGNNVIGVYINTSVWNLFIIPEEDWSQSKSIEEYEVNKLKNEDGYSCFYAFVQLPGHSSKTVGVFGLTYSLITPRGCINEGLTTELQVFTVWYRIE